MVGLWPRLSRKIPEYSFIEVESFYVSASYARENDQLTDITCFLEVNDSIPHYRKQLISINPAERRYDTLKADFITY